MWIKENIYTITFSEASHNLISEFRQPKLGWYFCIRTCFSLPGWTSSYISWYLNAEFQPVDSYISRFLYAVFFTVLVMFTTRVKCFMCDFVNVVCHCFIDHVLTLKELFSVYSRCMHFTAPKEEHIKKNFLFFFPREYGNESVWFLARSGFSNLCPRAKTRAMCGCEEKVNIYKSDLRESDKKK